MPEGRSFSIGVDRLLKNLRPYGPSGSSYPRNLDDSQSRRREGETLQHWFVRIVNEFCEGNPKLVAVEENLAVFARLGWKDRKQLSYASIQTVLVTCDLDDYYLGTDAEAIYLRLDFDDSTLGEPFSHPLAHIHLESSLSPRFALDGGDSGNIVVDYLEFLYRNYVPAKWLQWVQRIWAEDFAGSGAVGKVDPLPKLIDAFKSGQFQILRDYAADVDRIKRVLRKHKDELFDLHMDRADRIILEYPLAR